MATIMETLDIMLGLDGRRPAFFTMPSRVDRSKGVLAALNPSAKEPSRKDTLRPILLHAREKRG